jgi:hypothetical protein
MSEMLDFGCQNYVGTIRLEICNELVCIGTHVGPHSVYKCILAYPYAYHMNVKGVCNTLTVVTKAVHLYVPENFLSEWDSANVITNEIT